MTYLQSLAKHGVFAILTPTGTVRLLPRERVTEKIRQVAREKKDCLLSELQAHRQTMIDQAETFETRILAALESGRIDQAQAEDQLTYIFRLTATAVAVQGPCDCGEVLLWKHPGESLSLPLLCYRCHVPVFGAEYFLANDTAAAVPAGASDDLSHSRQWL